MAEHTEFYRIWMGVPVEQWTAHELEIMLPWWAEHGWSVFDKSLWAAWQREDPEGVRIWEGGAEPVYDLKQAEFGERRAKDLADAVGWLGAVVKRARGGDPHTLKLQRIVDLMRDRLGFVVVVREVEG